MSAVVWVILVALVVAVAAYVVGRWQGAKKQIVNSEVAQAEASAKAIEARESIAVKLDEEVKAMDAMDDQALIDSANADFANVELRNRKDASHK